jgi:multicomponent Na+:H+ antiporter subunit E
LRHIVLRAGLFALLWAVLTEGRIHGLGLAMLAVGAGAWTSLALVPPRSGRLSVNGIATFVFYFLRQSLLGGVDVARRALHPALPIHPGFLDYRLRLPDGPARVFLANTVSLLPGSLCAELRDSHLRVHLLDSRSPARDKLEELEERVARVFATELNSP